MPDQQIEFEPLAEAIGVFEEERPDPLVSEEFVGLAGRGCTYTECHCSSMMMG